MANVDPLPRSELTELEPVFKMVEKAMGFAPNSFFTIGRPTGDPARLRSDVGRDFGAGLGGPGAEAACCADGKHLSGLSLLPGAYLLGGGEAGCGGRQSRSGV